MPQTHQIRHAKQLAQQALDNRVSLIEKLAAATTTEDTARGILTATKNAATTAGPDLTNHIGAVHHAANALLTAATATTKRSRKKAANGGWSIADLHTLGLTKNPPRTRTTTTTTPTATPAATP